MQTLIELSTQGEVSSELGEHIIPLLAGATPDKSFGLAYFFTQRQLQDILETERQTQLMLMARQELNSASL